MKTTFGNDDGFFIILALTSSFTDSKIGSISLSALIETTLSYFLKYSMIGLVYEKKVSNLLLIVSSLSSDLPEVLALSIILSCIAY